MLAGIRNVTRGWIATALLSVLGVSFAVWGVRDVFHPTAPDAVASGGGVVVRADEFRKQFDQALEQAREEQKRNITRQEALDGGLADQVLREMIGTRAVDRMAAKAGFSVSNAMVAAAIRQEPAFRSQLSGGFDAEQYHAVLARNNISEAQFESDVRGGVARRALALTLVAGLHAPNSFAQLLYAYQTERRVLTIAAIPPSLVGAAPEPTDQDLKAFYEEHKTSFQTPELRTITVVKARPDAFAAKVDVPEDKIRQLYDFRKPSLAGGEKRTFVQISTADQASATEAARRLAAGEDPTKTAAAVNGQVVPFAMTTKQNVPDQAVAEAVFALQKGQSTGAIHSKLAWAAARVIDVAAAGAAPSYESQHDALRAELAKQESQNILSDAVDKFDQERSGGKSLEDAAKESGLDVYQVPNLNAQGATDQAGPVAVFGNAPDLLKAAFLAPLSEPTDFAPTPDGGYALVRVDAIAPAGTRPFDQVKAVLTPAWKANKTGDAMRAVADAVTKAVAGGQSFADAVKANKLKVVAASQSVDRAGAQNSSAPLLVQAAFGAKEGEVVTAPDANGQVLLVAQLEHVLREAPTRNPQLFAQAHAAADKLTADDMLLSLQNAAFAAANVKTNQKLVNATLGIEPSASAAPPAQ